MKTPPLLGTLAAVWLALTTLAAGAATLKNEWLSVTFAPGETAFTLRDKDGAVVLNEARVPDARAVGAPRATTHPLWGRGESLVLASAEGKTVARVAVYPGLPFVLLEGVLDNPQPEQRVVRQVPLITFGVNPALKAPELQTLGTGGLLPASKKPGSYAWLAVAEPKTRRGLVCAWLTHERAGGLVFASADPSERVWVEARTDYGTLNLAPGASVATETLALGGFADARLGLEAWADAVARVDGIRLPAPPSGFCTWYAEKHGRASDAKNLLALTDFTARNLKPHGFSFVQIDDGWQLGDSKNGPKKNFTAVNPKGPYADGLKPVADRTKELGLTPGLWFMPFAANWDDPWFSGHPDWFVKRRDGHPFDSKWSATCLDMTVPAVQAYVRESVSRIAREWGYPYFKMDGFHTGAGTSNIYVHAGYKDDDWADAVFSDPAKTNIDVFRGGIRLVRAAAGPEVFFLGCCVTQNMRSYEGSFGLVDAMRVGPDNSGSWKGWSEASPVFGSRHYFLNGRVWYNDPDPCYVRASLTLDEARTSASWTALSGQLFVNSDWIPDLPAERLDLLKRTLRTHRAIARPVDLFDTAVPSQWLVTDTRDTVRRDVVALYNWTDSPMKPRIDPAVAGLPAATAYAVFDYWADAFHPSLESALAEDLPPHSCRVLAVRPLVPQPFLLSTSAHVTQGIVDVAQERWDAATRTLSARSEVVAGDPYELRIVMPAGQKAVAARIATGETAEIQQKGSELRVRWTPAQSGAVNWQVAF